MKETSFNLCDYNTKVTQETSQGNYRPIFVTYTEKFPTKY